MTPPPPHGGRPCIGVKLFAIATPFSDTGRYSRRVSNWQGHFQLIVEVNTSILLIRLTAKEKPQNSAIPIERARASQSLPPHYGAASGISALALAPLSEARKSSNHAIAVVGQRIHLRVRTRLRSIGGWSAPHGRHRVQDIGKTLPGQ